MLTCIEWFRRVKDPVMRETLLAHYGAYRIYSYDDGKPLPSLVMALRLGFTWDKTPEGWAHWYAIRMLWEDPKEAAKALGPPQLPRISLATLRALRRKLLTPQKDCTQIIITDFIR
jgi:hypothetical protein